MCGINVIWAEHQEPSWIESMNDALVHRGPDEGGVYSDETVPLSLGSRRLKIIDMSAGRMPYRSNCGRYAMVFNGEIYNYRELRSQCGDYAFASQTDGEVFFAWLQQKGKAGLGDANGMFSFAFWDAQSQILMMARDRLGIKPLFYAWDGEHFFASSEMRGLRALPELGQMSEDHLNHEAMGHYLSLLSVPEPHSMDTRIQRFPTGQVATLSQGNLEFESYWRLKFPVPKQKLLDSRQHQPKAKKEIRQAFEGAVQKRLVSDVPLGLFLSSGIDSSIIASVATRLHGAPLECHGMHFEGGEDETAWAEKTARGLGCSFVRHELKEDDLLEHLPQLIGAFREPFAGGLPIWFLCREAKGDLTVALTGTGGDECFGQYGRAQHLSPQLGYWQGFKSFFKHPKLTMGPNVESFLYSLKHGAALGHFYHEKVCPMKEFQKREFLIHHAESSTEAYLNDVAWSNLASSTEQRLMALVMETQLKDEFLFAQDLLSMDHGMELRVPFLDHEFVEVCAKHSSQATATHDDPKQWMKAIFATEIPDHVLNLPKKGFMVPYGRWLRGALREQAESVFSVSFLREQNLFEHQAIQRVWLKHLGGEDQDYVLWSLFMFQWWWVSEFRNINVEWSQSS